MLYTVSQYAKLINKSRWTVYRMIEDNKLPKGVKFKEIGGVKFIQVKD